MYPAFTPETKPCNFTGHAVSVITDIIGQRKYLIARDWWEHGLDENVGEWEICSFRRVVSASLAHCQHRRSVHSTPDWRPF